MPSGKIVRIKKNFRIQRFSPDPEIVFLLKGKTQSRFRASIFSTFIR